MKSPAESWGVSGKRRNVTKFIASFGEFNPENLKETVEIHIENL
jgi:hypothetical protein